MEPIILAMLVLITVVSLLPMVVLYFNRKRQDEFLAGFYKACDDLRDHIHSCTSMAEAWEIVYDLDYVKDSYVHSIPASVLDKEIKLLDSLLTKKMKKIKSNGNS